MAEKEIHLNTVLAEMDLPGENGRQKVFSIRFIKKDGESVFMRRAVKTGLHNGNLKENALRGILQIDANGEKVGHPYPVLIWNIIEFNYMKVYL